LVYISKSKALKIFESCMNDLYLASEPSISWDEVKERYGGMSDSRFYLKHKISVERYDGIVDGYRKLLDKYYNRELSMFLLNYAPSFKLDGE